MTGHERLARTVTRDTDLEYLQAAEPSWRWFEVRRIGYATSGHPDSDERVFALISTVPCSYEAVLVRDLYPDQVPDELARAEAPTISAALTAIRTLLGEYQEARDGR